MQFPSGNAGRSRESNPQSNPSQTPHLLAAVSAAAASHLRGCIGQRQRFHKHVVTFNHVNPLALQVAAGRPAFDFKKSIAPKRELADGRVSARRSGWRPLGASSSTGSSSSGSSTKHTACIAPQQGGERALIIEGSFSAASKNWRTALARSLTG